MDEATTESTKKRSSRGCLWVFLGTVAVIIFIPCAVLLYNVLFMKSYERRVAAYHGDGTANVVGENFINYGYEIRLGSFDLSKDFHAEYKLGTLPETNKGINPHLRFYTEPETLEMFKSGNLTFELSTAAGEQLFKWSGPLHQWTYAATFDRERNTMEFSPYFYSDTVPIFFDYAEVKDKGDLVFTVTYTHGTQMTQPLEGLVLLDSGGFY